MNLVGTIQAFGAPLQIERTRPGDVVNGYYEPGEPETVTLYAIVTPSGSDSSGLPTVAIWASALLQTETRHGDEGSRSDADRFRWHGHTYRITSVDDWSQLGFYQAEAIRE